MEGYSRERCSKGVKSVACVVNPTTGNTNVLVGGGDGTLKFMNPSLNTISIGAFEYKTKLTGAITSLSVSPSGLGFYCGTEFSQRYYVDLKNFEVRACEEAHYWRARPF